MKLLALDPASQTTGYAVLDGPEPADLVESGLLVARTARLPACGRRPAELCDWLHRKEMLSVRRIEWIVQDVDELLEEHGPDAVVIETPSGLVGTGARRGSAGALTTYGLAAGVILEACRRRPGVTVWPVTERIWTREAMGGTNKLKRQAAVGACYAARYDAQQDPGGDASDAIALGRWWWGSVGRRRKG